MKKIKAKYNMLIYSVSFAILMYCNFNCNDTIKTTEPENIIYDWQSNPQFSNDGEKIVFEGLYDSINAIHFLDKNGSYLGYILDSIKEKKYVSSPSWGINNSIVVSIEGNLFLVNITNDSLTQLTNSYQDFSCTWSRDGNYIAYTKSICDPECGIVIYYLNNNSKKVVGKYGGHASWNMKSDKIYYYHNLYKKSPNSYITDYKGFVFKRVDMQTFETDSLFYVESGEGHLWLEDCAISPDEKEILFAASEGTPPQVYIWKINLDQKTLIKMTVGNHAEFSPDGSQIIYTNTNKSEGGLWIMNREGSNKKRFTNLNK